MSEVTISRSLIFSEINDERARQDAEFGGDAHNDTHTPADWVALVVKQLGKGYGHCFQRDAEGYRQRMINAAALIISAIESYDRLKEHSSVTEPTFCGHSVPGFHPQLDHSQCDHEIDSAEMGLADAAACEIDSTLDDLAAIKYLDESGEEVRRLIGILQGAWQYLSGTEGARS